MPSGINSLTGKSDKIRDLTGQRFGSLLVVEQTVSAKYRKGTRARWNCVCDCGQYCAVLGQSLIKNSTKSCGCLRKEVTRTRVSARPFEGAFNRLCREGIRRGYVVTLTYEEFLVFTGILSCHYCGVQIDWNPYDQTKYHLDRKNNHIGYTYANCVVCCKKCNYTKGYRLTYDEMLIVGKMRRGHIEETGT